MNLLHYSRADTFQVNHTSILRKGLRISAMSSAVPVAAGSDPLSQPTTSPSASAEPEKRASPQAGPEEREIEVVRAT